MKITYLYVWLIILNVLLYINHIDGLKCPSGSEQIGAINSDIGGCGLENCVDRYDKKDIFECKQHCEDNLNCVSFTWAPLGGDRNHVNEKVCTIYNSKISNQIWSPNQIMCGLIVDELICPVGTTQIGVINSDIGGCGLEDCLDRYDKDDIFECKQHCIDNPNCASFTWAPLRGDRNHVQEKVCTIYDSIIPNQIWSPNQIMCQPVADVESICDDYLYFHGAATYSDAVSICNTEDGADGLATIMNQDECDCIKSALIDYNSAWIGLNSINNIIGFFQYDDGTICPSEDNGLFSGACLGPKCWINKHPICVDEGGAKCVGVSSNGLNNDIPCHDIRNAVLCNAA